MDRAHASHPAEIPSGTLVDLFFEAVDRSEGRPAFRHHDGSAWRDISYAEAATTVRRIAASLRAIGLSRGDVAAILSANRPEWALADFGCLTAGVVDVPIYSTLTASQVGYILQDCGAKLVFVGDLEQLQKVEEVWDQCDALEYIVSFDPPENPRERILGWAAFLALAPEDDAADDDGFRDEARAARPEDTATILYTSGTTGDPKGVMLSHNNLHSNVWVSREIIPIDGSDSTLSFLPLSHVFQRMVDYLMFNRGAVIAYARSMETVAEDLKEIGPTIVVSVPRLYEKVYARVTDVSGPKAVLVSWARRVGERWADATLAGRRPGLWTSLQYVLASRLVFSKIVAAVGGRLRYFVSGGGPLSPDINKFFFSAGVTILEGYGLTETSPVTNVNSPQDFPDNFRIGTVGKPVPGTEIRIADDGEILVRGPQVMKGYFGRPEATAEAIDPEGWFHTGDVGELDADGFLRITDRKKDIIVTAGGKNVAPQPIENELKKSRYIDQPVLVGDRRKFLSLLLVPDFEALKAWAGQNGISTADERGLLEHGAVQELLEREVGERLDRIFSRVEIPKKIVLLDEGFTIEDGSLTPTQKVKRRVVEERFEDIIGSLYEEENVRRSVFTAWANE